MQPGIADFERQFPVNSLHNREFPGGEGFASDCQHHHAPLPFRSAIPLRGEGPKFRYFSALPQLGLLQRRLFRPREGLTCRKSLKWTYRTIPSGIPGAESLAQACALSHCCAL